jgi:hypothetical protein
MIRPRELVPEGFVLLNAAASIVGFVKEGFNNKM